MTCSLVKSVPGVQDPLNFIVIKAVRQIH
jgi:hypothetical protein